MSDPTKTPPGESVSVGDVAVTLVNQGVINTRITIVQPGNHASHPHAGHSQARAATHAHAHPAVNHPARPAAVNPPPAVAPTISFAYDGDTMTTYRASDGASATYREDRQNGGAVTLTLQDADGTLTTHGDRRGYEAQHQDALGRMTREAITLDNGWKWPTERGVVDRLSCPHDLLTGVNIVPAITGDVTRDQLQQFAARHPELAATLATVHLPVTVSGGRQQNFSEAQQQPSEFTACPRNASSDVMRKPKAPAH